MHQLITVFIGVVTLGLLIWTFYKDFLQSPKIKIHAGDSIDIVKLTDNTTQKIHIACTFTNTSRKTGIVNKVAVLLKKKGDNKYHLFNWVLFYDYQGGHIAHPTSKVCPISVPANSSSLQGIEFITRDEVKWGESEYILKIIAWIEKKSPLKKASMQDQFSVILSQSFIEQLTKREVLPGPQLRTVMIEERDLKKENMKECI